MTAILSVRDLEKTFGSIVAARDINVAVPAAADRRHHRRQRRRQDHLRQHDHRPSAADQRHDLVRATATSPAGLRARSPGSASRARSRWRRFSLADRIRQHVRGDRDRARCRRACPPGADAAALAGTPSRRARRALDLFRIAQLPRMRSRRRCRRACASSSTSPWPLPARHASLLLDEPTSGISIDGKVRHDGRRDGGAEGPAHHRAVRRARHGDRRALRRPRARLLRRRRDRRRAAGGDAGKSAHPRADQRAEAQGQRRGDAMLKIANLNVVDRCGRDHPRRYRSSSMPAKCAG